MQGRVPDKEGLQRTKTARPVRRLRRTQEERSRETRRKLVEAAICVVQESGYANLTISKVAQRARLSNGAVQHHFSSREVLVLAVLESLYDVPEIPLAERVSGKLTVRERINSFIDFLWRIYGRPEYLVFWDIAFGSRSDALLRQKLQDYQRDIRQLIRKQLAASFADMDLTPDGADKVCSASIGCLHGFALQAAFDGDCRRVDLDQVKKIACDQIHKYARIK